MLNRQHCQGKDFPFDTDACRLLKHGTLGHTFMVRISSLPMHFKILAMLLRLTPMLRLRSQRKCSNPSERSCSAVACHVCRYRPWTTMQLGILPVNPPWQKPMP